VVWHKKFTIHFVDGESIESTTRDWGAIRADGVDHIDFGCVTKSGDSVYYLYPENITETEIAWVVGSFAVYTDAAQESIMRQNGEVFGRMRRTMPDIKHQQLKLGWWRSGDH
jgi:hypothetical protein